MMKISKSFIRGFSRAFDLTALKEWPDIENGNEKDYKALRGDWENVGNAIKREAQKYGNRTRECKR